MSSWLKRWLRPDSAEGENPGSGLSATPSAPPSKWLRPEDPKLDFPLFYDSEAIRDWGSELAEAKKQASPPLWELVGTGAVVESADTEETTKLLQCMATKAGFSTARVPVGDVGELPADIRKFFAPLAPVLVILDPGVGLLEGVTGDPEAKEGTIARAGDDELAAAFKTFDAASPVILVLVAATEGVRQCLMAPGSLDRSFRIATPAPKWVGDRFVRSLPLQAVGETLTNSPIRVGLLLRSHLLSQREIDLAALHLRRITYRSGRPAEFADLASYVLGGKHQTSPGFQKTRTDLMLRKTAAHEAGHACLAVIGSAGRDIPDYVTGRPAADFEGVMLPSLTYRDAREEYTFNDLVHQTRIALAGRAAEQFFFGVAEISSGAVSDLDTATNVCLIVFAQYGFHAKHLESAGSPANLAVVDLGDIDPVQKERLMQEVRVFLAEQYQAVLLLMEKHRGFLEAVTDRLVWDPVLDREEMLALMQKNGLTVN